MSEDPQAWNYGNVQSAGGCCLVVGDKLYFYAGGTKWGAGSFDPNHTGLAILRRDGFSSLDAGETAGSVTTRLLRFSGAHLFVNVAAAKGTLRAEVLNEQGQPIAPFTADNCEPVSSDSTKILVKWKGAEDLSALTGQPVRFRFHVKNGSLYAFWVSPDASGASHGYVAAGGPGFTGAKDTTGR